MCFGIHMINIWVYIPTNVTNNICKHYQRGIYVMWYSQYGKTKDI